MKFPDRMPLTTRTAGTLLTLAIGLSACTDTPEPLRNQTAEVVDHQYDDADDWTTDVCVAYGDYGCKQSVSFDNHDDEHYYLGIKQCDLKDTDKCQVVEVEVNKQNYQQLNGSSLFVDENGNLIFSMAVDN